MRLLKNYAVVLLIVVSGCSSARSRLQSWWPHRDQPVERIADGSPARLPPALELPQPTSPYPTMPSAAIAPDQAEPDAVVFAKRQLVKRQLVKRLRPIVCNQLTLHYGRSIRVGGTG